MKQVYVIRHGQTKWNAEGRWQGHEDVPLSEEGYAQARALAEHLSDVDFSAVYASDLQRARETGRALAEATGAPLMVDPRLRELNLGVLQGLTHAEIRERYPNDDDQMKANYLDHVVTNGESRREMQARAYAAWQDMLDQTDSRPVALVSHGGTIRLLLLRLLDPAQKDEIMRLPISNTAWTVLDVDDEGRVHMTVAADHSHLQHHAADESEAKL
jgi:broad specificity phosphatase PhoE